MELSRSTTDKTNGYKSPWPVWVHLGIAAVVGVVVFLGAFLLLTATVSRAPTDSASPTVPAASRSRSETIDIIKIALSVVAGCGGVVALVVTYRRQSVAEQTDRRQRDVELHQQADALSRRVSDAYGQAIGQIASDKAAVRVGGLYALERLAQENLDYRQTVVDVMCAYLRAPIVLSLAQIEAVSPWVYRASDAVQQPIDQAVAEEIQVRITVQKILLAHLENSTLQRTYGQVDWPVEPSAPSGPTDEVWPQVHLNLSDATLIHFNPSYKVFNKVQFERCRFYGVSQFSSCDFQTATEFAGSVFDTAWFVGSRFQETANFSSTRFSDWALFDVVEFCQYSRFNGAVFGGVVGFREAIWPGEPVHVLNASIHENTSVEAVRAYPPGWAELPVVGTPNKATIEYSSLPQPGVTP